ICACVTSRNEHFQNLHTTFHLVKLNALPDDVALIFPSQRATRKVSPFPLIARLPGRNAKQAIFVGFFHILGDVLGDDRPISPPAPEACRRGVVDAGCSGRPAPAAGTERNADGDPLVSTHQTATTPRPAERHAVDGHGAPPVGEVIGVGTLEPVPCRPIVAAKAFALATPVYALKTIDWSAVLKPLHDAAPVLSPSPASAGPGRGGLGRGMPVPHPAPGLRIEQPAAFIARRRPADPKRIWLQDVARLGLLSVRHGRRQCEYATRHSRAGR